MARKPFLDPRRLRDEIAVAAARLIAEDGLDYAAAKRKAARRIAGDARLDGDWLPDNEQIEDEIRAYQTLFQADTQPAALHALRAAALGWMKRLAAFRPYLTGAVLNGTASSHSDVHLQLFCDNPKDVALFLLDSGVQYDVSETRHFNGRGWVETLSFVARGARMQATAPIGVHLMLYDAGDLRSAARLDARGRPARVDAQALAALLAAEPEQAL